MKILVVDDNSGLVRTMGKVLAKAGYEVTQANGFHEALDKASSQKFEILLTDFDMPEGNGIELIKRYREKNRKQKIVALIMTAYPEVELEIAKNPGTVDGFLLKPFLVRELLDMLKRYH
ncbi:response regulator [Candidatus Chlorohelix sp.]|uniref:response regulator n=1 Tax=Candidatus Chlorohelix sp. TaxID=3139201 RepID=UPI0030530313